MSWSSLPKLLLALMVFVSSTLGPQEQAFASSNTIDQEVLPPLHMAVLMGYLAGVRNLIAINPATKNICQAA